MADLAAFYEREYRGGEIPNYDQYFIDWRENSASARRELRCHIDLAYGTGPKETLDLFPAANSTRLLIFIHGGYWYSMDKSDYSCIAPNFVKAGISVAVPNYALAPSVRMETIVDQCVRAIAWLNGHAPEYGVRADHMVVTGHSAGGHLTGMMFATDWPTYGMSPEAIAGGVALSGLFELEPFLLLTLNDDLHLTQESIKTLSPARLKPKVNAPLIAAVGDLESSEFKRQTRMLCESWPTTCLEAMTLEGNHHFNILDTFTNLDSRIWQVGKQILWG